MSCVKLARMDTLNGGMKLLTLTTQGLTKETPQDGAWLAPVCVVTGVRGAQKADFRGLVSRHAKVDVASRLNLQRLAVDNNVTNAHGRREAEEAAVGRPLALAVIRGGYK